MSGDCIEWWGTRNSQGYGVLKRGGKMIRAHRLVWEECFGPIPDDKPFILHSCDNPPCVNPEHLRPGTPQENMDDKIERNRWAGGRPRAETCVNGHEWTEENTYLGKRKKGPDMRQCKRCRADRARERYWANKIDLRRVR